VLNNDHHQAPFQYVASEKPLHANFGGVRLYGIADRIDIKGGVVRMIYYKTGHTDLKFDTMAKVFGVAEPSAEGTISIRTQGQRQILQTLLYCWLFTNGAKDNSDSGFPIPNSPSSHITPYIYSVRRLQPEDMPAVERMGSPLVLDETIKQEFVTELQSLLEEMFDRRIPYYATTDKRTCESCAFAPLCNL
jgi:hypothetical protein